MYRFLDAIRQAPSQLLLSIVNNLIHIMYQMKLTFDLTSQVHLFYMQRR
jgi:hypothetical protein